jgi:hypothetical protein
MRDYANPVMLLDGLPIDGANVGQLQRVTLWTFDKVLRALGLQGTGGSTSTRNIAVPSVTDQFVARAMPSAKGGLMADRSTRRLKLSREPASRV